MRLDLHDRAAFLKKEKLKMRFEDMLTYTLDAVIFGFSLVYLSVQLRPLHKGTIRGFSLRVCVCVCVRECVCV